MNAIRKNPLRVVVIGLGQMGASHALAYHRNPDFEIVGLINRTPVELAPELRVYPMLRTFEEGLALAPDVMSINTYTDSHAELAIAAMKAGCHVFVEKPLSVTLESAREVIATAKAASRKLVIGYILRYHPSWKELIRTARALGGPYVMRMNLNQPSTGGAWAIHKRLLATTPPIVDCGVHYVDVMCQITDARAVQVRGMGARLAADIPESQMNYGHLQVLFADGSVGWYEAGWGAMMSRTAAIVKDVVGAKGAVTLITDGEVDSADIESHTMAGELRIHALEFNGEVVVGSTESIVPIHDEVGHQILCEREQAFVADAIRSDLDLTPHHEAAMRSMEIVFAAEQSIRERRAIDL